MINIPNMSDHERPLPQNLFSPSVDKNTLKCRCVNHHKCRELTDQKYLYDIKLCTGTESS